MRLVVLLLLASCSHGWQQSSAPEREPDSATIYPEDGPHQPIEKRSLKPYPPTGSPIGAVACRTTTAAFALVTLSLSNATPFVFDICRSIDRQLSRTANAVAIGPGFELELELESLQRDGAIIYCRAHIAIRTNQLTISTQAIHARVEGIEKTTAKLDINARDCFDALVSELIEKQMPALQSTAPAAAKASPPKPLTP